MASNLAAQAFLHLGQWQPQETEGNSPVLDTVVQGAGCVSAHHIQAGLELLGRGGGLETLHHQHGTRRFLAFLVALLRRGSTTSSLLLLSAR